MRLDKIEETVILPDQVKAVIDDISLIIEGPKGAVSRRLLHPAITITVADGKIVLVVKKPSKREKRQLFTYAAHIRNMCRGAVEGHTYKLKICSGHFPMTVTAKGQAVEVKNFFGETIPRRIAIPEGVTIKIEGAVITLESTDKEKAGAAAASLERLTRRTGFDKRIFQDGIYIIEKDGKPVEA